MSARAAPDWAPAHETTCQPPAACNPPLGLQVYVRPLHVIQQLPGEELGARRLPVADCAGGRAVHSHERGRVLRARGRSCGAAAAPCAGAAASAEPQACCWHPAAAGDGYSVAAIGGLQQQGLARTPRARAERRSAARSGAARAAARTRFGAHRGRHQRGGLLRHGDGPSAPAPCGGKRSPGRARRSASVI